jgi:DNA-binding LacI/PurR family transcriptional regulator
MRELFALLEAAGHETVGYLGGPADSWVNGRRRSLARQSAAAGGIRLLDLGVHAATPEAGALASDAVLAAGVTAVVAFDDALALGLMSELSVRGVDIPGDVSIAAFDDLNYSSLVRPGITSIAADPAQLAAEALALLSSAVAGQLEGTSASVPAVLRLRPSVGPAPVLDTARESL